MYSHLRIHWYSNGNIWTWCWEILLRARQAPFDQGHRLCQSKQFHGHPTVRNHERSRIPYRWLRRSLDDMELGARVEGRDGLLVFSLVEARTHTYANSSCQLECVTNVKTSVGGRVSHSGMVEWSGARLGLPVCSLFIGIGNIGTQGLKFLRREKISRPHPAFFNLTRPPPSFISETHFDFFRLLT